MTRKLRGNHCRCAKCGEDFNSVAAFDKHRTGDHGPARRCRTIEEMLTAKMAVSNGWWVTASNPRGYPLHNSVSNDQENLIEG